MNPHSDNHPEKIRITLDDLNQVDLQAAAVSQPRSYGTVAQSTEQPATTQEVRGSILMKAWFYLGLAGFTGALLAWAVCEPWFIDGNGQSWANQIIFPLMLILICIGFGMAEGIVERSLRKAALRGLVATGLGTVFGFLFYFIANIIFTLGLAILSQAGTISERSPALWIIRGVAWMAFGVAGGVVYGIVGQSGKRCLYGIGGGVLGAGLGGMVFDPISIVAGGAGASRAVGMALLGAVTGAAMGLVESALKDRWLYVSSGPLAGKQFILYKPLTTIGSSQSCDIYLFKDPSVLQRHATIELRNSRVHIRAEGPAEIQGRPFGEAILRSGDEVRIGRYAFLFRDRERSS